ncbi:lysophospholipase [Patescibacteria group bacterium]|nr:lysophospholipase [Patescibacteria group bacterium]MBU1783472.1 lysophospholipase [Patescibacteria group bacterium]MBU1991728.1 lysophospholipase [Patescibacteria group bacterium]MBU2081718.1 lysophospholipase [Patescibacteria group bacterium]MBU2250355.1 lysophospholipase [Patescibacteria group bacterium]
MSNLIIIFSALIGIIIGDAIYSTIVKYRLKQWESHIERDIDGIQQGRQEFTVGNGEIALLMLHGFGDSPSVYKKIAPALAKKGFTCKAMRLPGFAEPMNKYAKTNMDLWLEALDREINQLKQNHKHVWIIAHSLGGAITIKYLLENPKAVDGVILLAPLIKVFNQCGSLFPTRMLYEIGIRCLFITKIFENYIPIDVNNPEEKKKYKIFCDRFIPRNIYNELFKLIDSFKGKEDKFNVPMLMILSQKDKIIESNASKQFFQKSSSTHKRLIVLENSGHVIPLDYEWKEAVSAILTFINGAY